MAKMSNAGQRISDQSRTYTSPLRAAQALRTRRAILEAAARCFADAGYAGTTLADIATTAGVSVETIQAHGPKPALLLAALEKAFALSEGQDSILDRPGSLEMAAQLPDAMDFVRASCTFLAGAAERSAGLWLVFYHAATIDPSIREAYDAFSERVRVDTLRLVNMIGERGPLRQDRTRQRMADELELLYRPTGYEQLCEKSGWTVEQYRDYLFRNTCWILFPSSRRRTS
jgi:AcrR family transcriptional regulator